MSDRSTNLYNAINFNSHKPTFTQLTEKTKIHPPVKPHQNMTSNFQVTDNFSTKYEKSSQDQRSKSNVTKMSVSSLTR